MYEQSAAKSAAKREEIQDCLDAGMTSTLAIANKVGLKTPTVAKHLKALRDAL